MTMGPHDQGGSQGGTRVAWPNKYFESIEVTIVFVLLKFLSSGFTTGFHYRILIWVGF